MPLTINVGLSRKASKDFQSAGYSLNLTAELDQALLGRPDELQQQIDALYRQAEDAIDRQAQGGSSADAPVPSSASSGDRPNGWHRGGRNGHAGGDRPGERYREGVNGRHAANGYGGEAARQGNGSRPSRGGGMTESQRRAITAIARRNGVDLAAECQDIIGVAFDELLVRQASELIDHLKTLQPNGQ